jgi:hypothetical protein
MKILFALLLSTALAGAQSSPPSTQSRVAGRFVAYNYGLWQTNPTKIGAATGVQTFTVNLQFVTLADGRQVVPWSTNAPIYVGTEKVTPSAVSGCSIGDTRPGICSITATFSQSHTVVDTVTSATFGLQEALNDAGSSGGGAVVIDSAWTNAGGTTAIKNAATLPTSTGVEDARTGAPSGGGTGISGATSGQALIAGSATTATSSKALAGSGAAITTGPASSTSGDCAQFTGNAGQVSDSGSACGGGTPLFPNNMTLYVDGASVAIGFNRQGEAYISAQAGGSGYSGTGTTTISGLTCTTQPTVSAFLDPVTSGALDFSITALGQGCTGTGTASPSGFTGGSGASATLTTFSTNYPSPWPKILTTLPAMAGKVSTYTNFALSSQTYAGIIANFTTNSYATLCAAGTNKFFLLSGDAGQNSVDPAIGNLTPAVAYSQYVAITHALKAAGCKVIVSTPILKGTVPAATLLTNVPALAQLIRNGIPGVDYDYLIDHGAAVMNVSDLTLFAYDSTHPTASGHQMFADVANSDLITNGVRTLGLIPAQFIGNLLNVTGAGTMGNLVINGGSLTTPIPNAGNIQFFSGGPYMEYYSMSNSSTPGGHIFYGVTSGNVQTQLASLTTSGGATFASSVTATTSMSTAGPFSVGTSGGMSVAGYTAPASNKSYFDYLAPATYIYGGSNSGTAGSVNIQLCTSTPTCTQHFQFAPTSDSFTVPVSLGNLSANLKALALDGSKNIIAATIAGSGAGLVTGPTSSTVAGDVTTYQGTTGQIQDSGILLTSLATAISTPNGTATCTAGTNVTSCVCASGYTCTNTRGVLTIVGGTATTGTIGTLNFSTTLGTAPGWCSVIMDGGSGFLGLGHGVPSTTGFTITAGIAVTGVTLTADYQCIP